MKICILSHFNPICLESFYDEESKAKVVDTNVVSSSVNAIALGLLGLGHNVMLITISNSVDELTCFRGERVEVYMVPWGNRSWWKRYFVCVFLQIKEIRRIINQNIESINIIHAQWTYNYAFASLTFANTIPTCCTVRDWHPYLRTLMSFKQKWSTFELLRRLFFHKVMNSNRVHIIANSDYTYRCLKEYNNSNKYVVIPNSVRKEFLVAKERRVLKKRQIISIQQCVDEPRKNVLTLLDAYSKIRESYTDVSLLIVGTFDEDGIVYSHAQELNLLDSVVFYGKTTHLDLIDLIDESIMLVHPALEETFGNIFLEAMARRVPTIGGKKSGAVPHVLGNGKYGCLCDVESSQSIYEAIIKLLSNDKYVEEITSKAYNVLLEKYSEEAVAKQHEKFYVKVSKMGTKE